MLISFFQFPDVMLLHNIPRFAECSKPIKKIETIRLFCQELLPGPSENPRIQIVQFNKIFFNAFNLSLSSTLVQFFNAVTIRFVMR